MTAPVPMLWSTIEPSLGGKADELVAVLDVGSTKMCCCVARRRADGGFDVLGKGHQLAEGLRAGEVVDAEAAEASILAVVHEAEQAAGETLREVALCISGGDPASQPVTVDLVLDGRMVGGLDVQRLLEHARSEAAADGREPLHVVPESITIDGGAPLRDPRGVSGERLEATIQAVTVESKPLAALLACVERCHLEASTVVAAPYASALATLTRDEARVGAVVLDMGGSTTGIACFSDERLRHLGLVPLGGGHVTRDLAFGLSTGQVQAERIKALYASVVMRSCDHQQMIEVPAIGPAGSGDVGSVARSDITRIVRPRVEEILRLAKAKLDRAPDIAERAAGLRLVVTGGASAIEGCADLASSIFGMPARRGRPGHLHGPLGPMDEPCFSAVAGALALAAGDDGGLGWRGNGARPALAAGLARIGLWLRQNF